MPDSDDRRVLSPPAAPALPPAVVDAVVAIDALQAQIETRGLSGAGVPRELDRLRWLLADAVVGSRPAAAMIDPLRLLNLAAAADLLGVSMRTVRRLIEDGSLPNVKPVPGSIRVMRGDVAALVASRRSSVFTPHPGKGEALRRPPA